MIGNYRGIVMNIVQLKYFNAVCAYGSILSASEYLHISQPSISAAIKDLEREFGIELFYRRHTGMELTKEGQEFLQLSTKLIQEFDLINRAMNDLGNNDKVLRLGVPPMIGSMILSKIYDGFLREYEQVKLEIIEDGRKQLMALLEENKLDLVILPHNLPFDKRLKSIEIAQLEICCCVQKENVLSNLQVVCPQQLADQKIVLFKNSYFQTEEIKKWFALSSVEPNILMQTDQLSTLKNLVESGSAIGFMFRQISDNNNYIKAIPLDRSMSVKVSLVWNGNNSQFSSMKNFISWVKKNKGLL